MKPGIVNRSMHNFLMALYEKELKSSTKWDFRNPWWLFLEKGIYALCDKAFGPFDSVYLSPKLRIRQATLRSVNWLDQLAGTFIAGFLV